MIVVSISLITPIGFPLSHVIIEKRMVLVNALPFRGCLHVQPLFELANIAKQSLVVCGSCINEFLQLILETPLDQLVC